MTNTYHHGIVFFCSVRRSKKKLKEAEKKKPAVIQVCVHDLCLVYHICHADIECEEFKKFLKGGLVKFVTVDFRNNKEILGRIGLVVGNPIDLQKKGLVCSRDKPSMQTLAGAMVHPSYGKLKKPPFKFHHAWEWNVLDIDHIHYAAMDGNLCFNIYKGWMKCKSQVY